MRVVNIDVASCGSWSAVYLGIRGENLATEVAFDFTAFVEDFGNGTLLLLNKRSGERDAYPVTLQIDGNTAVWSVSNSDTDISGYGQCELFYYIGEKIAKSVVFTTYVSEDIGGVGEEPPDPYKTWIQSLVDEFDEEFTHNGLPVYKSANSYRAVLTVLDGAEDLPVKSLVIRFTPNQTGTPSPTNIQSMSGYTSISIKHGTNIITAAFGETVYAGYADIVTGKLVKEFGFKVFDGTETISGFNAETGRFYIAGLEGAISANTNGRQSEGWCSHYTVVTNTTSSAAPDKSVAYSLHTRLQVSYRS